MTSTITFMPFLLDLFDGGAAGGEGGAAAAPAASGAERSVPEGAPALKSRKAGAFENVVYGRPPAAETGAPDAGGQADQGTDGNPEEDRKAQYRKFKEGEFKDLFDADITRIMGRATKKNSALQAQIDAQKPVLDMLMQRYQVADGDYKALMEKVENDSAYWSEAADEAGMSVEQYKAMQKLERENKALLEAQRRRQDIERDNRKFARWAQEAQETKKKFPSFDMEREMQNPAFVSLIDSKIPVPVEHAYKVIHMDELMSNAMMTTAAATEQKITANVRAKGARPAEAANTPKGAVTYKSDPSKFTKADRAEIARRSLRGEKVSF